MQIGSFLLRMQLTRSEPVPRRTRPIRRLLETTLIAFTTTPPEHLTIAFGLGGKPGDTPNGYAWGKRLQQVAE
jgi:hypothetical protein